VPDMDYSVLMSVYYKEKPEHLKASMESIFNQTVKTNDFVLMCDGPLTEELDAVIEAFQKEHTDVLHVVHLEKNVGLGSALNAGVQQCRNELIARMDSDDIARDYRCERELAVFEKNPELAIVGSVIEEFSQSPDQIEAKRIVPEKHEDILEFAKVRNPFNHPSVMYRKSAVLEAGNYQSVRFMQDYYLWIAMLIRGCRGYNIQEPLVWMRADANLFKRRSGRLYVKLQLDLFRIMLDNGFITYPRYLKSCAIRICSGIAPNWIRRFMFRNVLRSR